MNLREILNTLSTIINQKNPSLELTIEKYNQILKMGNYDYFKQWTGLPEEWRPGQPLSSRSWQISNINTEALKPFLEFSHDTIVDANGQISNPADLVQISNIGYLNTDLSLMVPVEGITHNELYSKISNPIDFPTNEYPIYVEYSDYIQFYPKDLLNVDLTYLRLPVTPVYVESIVNGVNTYDSVNSVQLEWNERFHNDIIRILLGYLGISSKDINISQYAEAKKQQGV